MMTLESARFSPKVMKSGALGRLEQPVFYEEDVVSLTLKQIFSASKKDLTANQRYFVPVYCKNFEIFLCHSRRI